MSTKIFTRNIYIRVYINTVSHVIRTYKLAIKSYLR